LGHRSLRDYYHAIIGFVIFALGCRYADSERYNRDSEWLAETKRLQDIGDELELQRFNRVYGDADEKI